ncbi:hypothetical protein [Phocaeicola sp.]
MKRLVYIIILQALSMWFTSCQTQYVPIESVRTDIQYRDRWQKDSTHVHDSIFMYIKGDTVFRDRWHTEYKDRLLRDTTYIERTDSVQVPYLVEKKLTRWQSIKQAIGGLAIGGIAFLLLVVVWQIRKK